MVYGRSGPRSSIRCSAVPIGCAWSEQSGHGGTVTHFTDLTPYSYLPAPLDLQVSALNVGWLARGHAYEEGEMDQALLLKLGALCRNPVNITRGLHGCDLCDGPGLARS